MSVCHQNLFLQTSYHWLLSSLDLSSLLVKLFHLHSVPHQLYTSQHLQVPRVRTDVPPTNPAPRRSRARSAPRKTARPAPRPSTTRSSSSSVGAAGHSRRPCRSSSLPCQPPGPLDRPRTSLPAARPRATPGVTPPDPASSPARAAATAAVRLVVRVGSGAGTAAPLDA